MQLNFRFLLKYFTFLGVSLLLSACDAGRSEVVYLTDDLYLLPASKTEKECTMYHPHSKSGKPVQQVIYFRLKDGSVTTDSDPDNCR